MKRTTTPKGIKATAKLKTDLAVEAVKQMSIQMSDEVVPKDIVDRMVAQVYTPQSGAKKNKGGRPTKYTPMMCRKVIEIMAGGKSRGNAATLMGVTEATFYGWMDLHEEFLKAVKIGDQLSELWWMTMGQLNIHNKEFNSTLYMMQMQNRFGWSRRLEGRVDINTRTETVDKKIIEIKGDEQFAAIARILYESGAVKSGSESITDTQTH